MDKKNANIDVRKRSKGFKIFLRKLCQFFIYSASK